MEAMAKLMSALSEPIRLRALFLLWDGRERCLCELMKSLGASQSRMSRHMGILKTAGLVASRRDAQWVRYRRNPKLSPRTAGLLKSVFAACKKGSRK